MRGDEAPAGPRAGQRSREWLTDAATLFGLAGIALTQPLFEVLGNQPELFIAAHYSRTEIVGLVALVALAPAALAIAAVTLVRAISSRAASFLHRGISRLFIAMFGVGLARQVPFDALVAYVIVAVLVTFALIELFDRVPLVRRFVVYLALSSVVFPIGFAFSPSAQLLASSPARDTVHVPELDGPVVVIVLDELPLTTLLKSDGSINADRFPTFAALAEESTWHRNASSPDSHTERAVPLLLTGHRPAEGLLPTYHDQPRNLFTLLGASLPVHRIEVVSDLCPPELCDRQANRPLGDVMNDLAIVYGRRVLHPDLGDLLPSIDNGWGSFGEETSYRDDGPRDGEWRARGNRLAAGEARLLIDRGRLITPEPALHFMHVVVPHSRWTLSPWGYEDASGPSWDGTGTPGSERATIQRYQRHVMQVGAADQALGEVVRHMKAVGAWDRALVVVTSDHGISLTPPDIGKDVTPENIDEVLRVPLFIKAPGQERGLVNDEPASTIDVLPSIVDLLGITVDWELDGHSLYDGSEAAVAPAVTDLRDAYAVVRRHALDFGGDTWRGLAAVGDHRALVGTLVEDHEVGEPSALRWRLEDRALLRDLPAGGVRVPYLLRGTVVGTRDAPPELVVAVDGDIGGTVGGYSRGEDDDTWELRGTITDAYHQGANDVRAYEVERTASGIVLHEVRSA